MGMASLHRDLFYDQTFNTIFDAEQRIEALLRFEKELAIAQAAMGMIPQSAALAIENYCQSDRINIERLTLESAQGGNVLIALLRQCTELMQKDDSDSSNYIHFGATSQDAIDTASMIQYQKATYWISSKLKQLIQRLVRLAEMHHHTPMIGRTFLQQAKPITFGLKIAGWIDGLFPVYQSINALRFPIQIGGAVGSWTGLDAQTYEKMSAALAKNLQLDQPFKPWHSQRQPIMQIATTLGMLNAQLSKLTNDLVLMAQTEIGEISFNVPGQGGSSSMPHKNNPVNGILVLSNGMRIPHLVSAILQCAVTDHERALGSWHAEWETMEDLYKLTAGSLRLIDEMLAHLVVYPERMMTNINWTNGLVFSDVAVKAMAVKLGKITAHDLVEKACMESRATGISLQTILEGIPEVIQNFSLEDLENWFKIENNLGLSNHFTGLVLKRVKDVFGG